MNAKEYEFLVGKHDVPEHRLNSSVEYRRTKREINCFLQRFIFRHQTIFAGKNNKEPAKIYQCSRQTG